MNLKGKTDKHLLIIRSLLMQVVQEFITRANEHDIQKEVVDYNFVDLTDKLKTLEYGSVEYNNCLDAMQHELENHNKTNNHHIEYFENGVNDMNMFDIFEYFIDMQANLLYSKDCTLEKSLEIQKDIHGFDSQLYSILKNTIPLIEKFTVNTNLKI